MTEKYNREKKRRTEIYLMDGNESQTEQIIYRVKNDLIYLFEIE